MKKILQSLPQALAALALVLLAHISCGGNSPLAPDDNSPVQAGPIKWRLGGQWPIVVQVKHQKEEPWSTREYFEFSRKLVNPVFSFLVVDLDAFNDKDKIDGHHVSVESLTISNFTKYNSSLAFFATLTVSNDIAYGQLRRQQCTNVREPDCDRQSWKRDVASGYLL